MNKKIELTEKEVQLLKRILSWSATYASETTNEEVIAPILAKLHDSPDLVTRMQELFK